MRSFNNSYKLLAGALALVLVAGMTSPAFAQVSGVDETVEDVPLEGFSSPLTVPEDLVYENGVPIGTGNSFFIHTNSVANDFVLDNSESITDVHFVLVERDDEIPTTFDGVMQYAIFADSKGVGVDPFLPLGLGNAINLETEFLETTADGRDRILVWFDFENPIPLDAGTTYWLWLHAGDDFVDDERIGWEVNTSPIGECTVFYDGTDVDLLLPNEVCIFDVWFQLTASNPPIGGTVGSLDTATLLVAGAQSNMGLWSLALVGIVGAGVAITYKIKSKKTEQ